MSVWQSTDPKPWTPYTNELLPEFIPALFHPCPGLSLHPLLFGMFQRLWVKSIHVGLVQTTYKWPCVSRKPWNQKWLSSRHSLLVVESCVNLKSCQYCLHSIHLASDAEVAPTPALRSFPFLYFPLNNCRYLVSVWPFIWFKLQQCDNVIRSKDGFKLWLQCCSCVTLFRSRTVSVLLCSFWWSWNNTCA